MAKPIVFKVPQRSQPLPPYDFPNGFSGGMNISVSPDQISPSQSPDMQDVNYDDGGVPTKRYGFSRVNAESWGTPIRGTHEFYQIGITEPIFLIAQGGKLYSYNEITDTRTDLCTGTVTSFADNQVTFFDVGDKCYFLTGNEFLYYDGVNPVATVQSIAYVPTTVMGRAPTGTGGSPNEKFNHLTNKWKESFSADNTATVYQLTKQVGVTLSANVFTAWVDGVQKAETTDFTVNRTDWTVTFGVAPPLGTDNVVIQAEATNLMDKTVVEKCTMALEYGGKNDSRVMISGHPNYPNMIRYCAVYDPTYWPEDDDFNVGSDARSISGWGRMGEYLITYKYPGDETKQWYSEIDIDTDGNVSFPTFGLNDEFGCIAPRTVHPASDGLLALSDKGVIWTWPSLVEGKANCKVISRNINGRNGIAKGLLDNTQADLKNAHAEVHMNKYILFAKDKAWVLDLDYSDLANNVYCWYPYLGIYSKSGNYLIRNQALYIADKSVGLLYREERYDEALQYLDDGEPIDDYWQAPLMFLGGRDKVKKFERIGLTFKAQYCTDHILTLITEQGEEDILLRQEAGVFSYAVFSYKYHTYGTGNRNYPHTQSEKIGYKGEYISFRVRNNIPKRGMTLLAANVQYSILKQVK